MITVMLLFPNSPLHPTLHSTPICRYRLAPRAQRIKEEKSKVLREIRNKEKKKARCCLEERDKRRDPGRKKAET